MAITSLVVGLIDFSINIGSVSKKSVEIQFEAKANETYYTLSSSLYKEGLIRSEFWYKVYIKLTKLTKLQAGTYILNKNMSVKEIISVLEGGTNSDPNAVNLTFKEGYNIRKVASLIASRTNNTYDDVINTVKDQAYINELINKYWFLTPDILNGNIYYSLEGYLFPDTYQVSKKSSVKEIFKVMLDKTNIILMAYKTDIQNSKYTLHQIITLASIIELEAANADDRAGVAGVFYNRLSAGWALGSDVTTYYGSKIDDFKYSLTIKELNDCSNAYNTRCQTKVGLPIGPIDNPGEASLKAAMEPTIHNYYYFVADCTGKTYLNYDYIGHNNTINKLKTEGNWCA
jgi:UPF0755 protein